MKIQLLIIIMYILSVVYHCTSITNTSSKDSKEYVYVNKFPGIYSIEPNEKGKFIKLFEKLELLKKNNTEYTVKRENGEIINILKDNTSDVKDEFKFQVMTNSGLFLREEPNANSKKLDLLPVGTEGNIIAVSEHIQQIKDKLGPWINVEYNGKKGWIYSGYTLVMDKDKYEESKNIKITFKPYQTIDEISLQKLLKKGKKFLVSEDEYYEVFEIQFLKKEDEVCNEAEWNKIIYKNKKNNTYFAGSYSRAEHIMSKNYPLNGIFYEKSISCYCCCAPTGKSVVILDKERVFRLNIDIFTTRTTSKCYTSPEYGEDELYVQTRFIPDKNLILSHVKFPNCSEPVKIGIRTDNEKIFVLAESYLKEDFISLDISNRELKYKIISGGILDDHKQLWESGQNIKQIKDEDWETIYKKILKRK